MGTTTTARQRMTSYEELGSFYLGRERDGASGKTTDTLTLYDSSDLTTHAVLGMLLGRKRASR